MENEEIIQEIEWRVEDLEEDSTIKEITYKKYKIFATVFDRTASATIYFMVGGSENVLSGVLTTFQTVFVQNTRDWLDQSKGSN